jgi:hypothetical protein
MMMRFVPAQIVAAEKRELSATRLMHTFWTRAEFYHLCRSQYRNAEVGTNQGAIQGSEWANAGLRPNHFGKTFGIRLKTATQQIRHLLPFPHDMTVRRANDVLQRFRILMPNVLCRPKVRRNHRYRVAFLLLRRWFQDLVLGHSEPLEHRRECIDIRLNPRRALPRW